MSVCPMRSEIAASKKWEGRVVDGKFPLRQWLGGSDHSAVFLTERAGTARAAIKLIAPHDLSPNGHSDENFLSRWAVTGRVSHPNLIRLFEFGRCQLEDERFLYVVMELADEDLGQIIPQRRLSPPEVAEMLPPIIEALSFLHAQGFVHGDIKPSNVLALGDQIKISADNLRHIGEPGNQKNGAYSAPEANAGLSPASDAWSIGALLTTVFTQQQPDVQKREGAHVVVPGAVPEPYRTMAERCLRIDPKQRCNPEDLLQMPRVPQAVPQGTPRTTSPEAGTRKPQKRRLPRATILLGVVILLFLLGRMVLHRQSPPPQVPAAQPQSPAQTQPPAATAAQGTQHGSVQHRVLPDVSRQAQRTVHGKVKVNVQLSVDASGNVTLAKLSSAASSHYFANKSLDAAREWKFTPPQVDGQPSPSTWQLRFEFGRGSTQVIPSEIKP